jgi:hypothetical protein
MMYAPTAIETVLASLTASEHDVDGFVVDDRPEEAGNSAVTTEVAGRP